MKWWNNFRNYISNQPYDLLGSVTIQFYKRNPSAKITAEFKRGQEYIMAQIIFDLSHGLYVDDLYEHLGSKLTENQIDDILSHLRDMNTAKQDIETIFGVATAFEEKPFVSPSKVFAGAMNAQSNS